MELIRPSHWLVIKLWCMSDTAVGARDIVINATRISFVIACTFGR